jgi:hypothetical protein
MKVLIESPREEEEEEEEDSEREYEGDKMTLFKKGKRSQGQIDCATILIRMDILLPNVHMRGRKKIMTRERSLTKATRKIRNTLRRRLMVKPMLAKNETQVIRIPNRKVMRWQP